MWALLSTCKLWMSWYKVEVLTFRDCGIWSQSWDLTCWTPKQEWSLFGICLKMYQGMPTYKDFQQRCSSLKEKAMREYKQVLRQIKDYCKDREIELYHAVSLYKIVNSYVYNVFKVRNWDRKEHANQVLYAVKFYPMKMKHNLPLSHRAMIGRAKVRPMQQEAPCLHQNDSIHETAVTMFHSEITLHTLVAPLFISVSLSHTNSVSQGIVFDLKWSLHIHRLHKTSFNLILF